APGDGRGDPDHRFRGRRHRRSRQLLGRCPRGAARRRRARGHGAFRAGGLRGVDVRPDVPCAAAASARPSRRANPEVGALMSSKAHTLLIGLAALVALPVLMPLLGLTVTSATTVVVLSIAALGLNMM